jgi:choline dehydrogenase-like flavoprotein
MREALKASVRFINVSTWDGFINEPFGPFADALAAGTDEALEDYARTTSGTVWHLASSAAMSSVGSHSGVLDPDLKVKGAVGLRVADASAFVSYPSFQLFSPNAETCE